MAAIDIAIVTKGTNQTYSAGGSTIGGAGSVNRLLSVSEVDANFINLKQGVVDLEYTASITYAPLSSPALTGTGGNPATYSRTIPTGTSTSEIATTAFVQQELGPTASLVSDVNVGNQALNTKISLKANLNGPTTFTGAVRLSGANNATLAGDAQRIVNTGYVDYKLQNIDVNLLPTTGGQVNIGTSANYINQIYVKEIVPAGTNTSIGSASNPFDEGYFANNTIFIGSAGLSQGAAGGIVLPEGSAFGDEDSTIPRNLISTELDKAFGDLTSGPKKAIKLTLVASGGISSGDAIILNSNGTVSAISSTNTSFIGFAATSATNGNSVDIIVAGPVTGLSGLLTNSEVLVSSTGTLKFSRTLPSDIKVGTATSTTELFLYSTSTMDIYALAKAKAELADFSVNTASAGSNGLTYNSSTGVFDFTPVDLSTFATQAYVNTEIANLVNSAPTSLDTLDELAAALNDDANFASTVTNSIGTKAPLASPALTGTPTAPTASSNTNTTQIATTAFVQTEIADKIEFTNLSVTTAAASSGGALSYNNSTGAFTFTPADTTSFGNASLNSFSVTTNTASSGGALSYNNSTGVFSFTPAVTFDGAYSSLSGVPSTIAHTNADIDIGSNDFITTGKVLFSNVYSALSDLPSASTYHGMFAHVHATGKGYFAHAGNWIALANDSTTLAGYGITDAVSSSTHTTDLALKAPLASPVFTGIPTAPTASANTNNTQIATTEYVDSAVGGASGTYTNASVDSHLNTGTANSGEVLSWNGSDYDWVAQSGGGGGGASVTTSDAAPSSPSAGDLWYNTNAGGLFVYYTDANSSQWVEVVGKTGATGAAGTNISIGDAAPSSPTVGQLWWNSSANKLYIRYQDADSTQWVQATTPGATGADGTTAISDTAPSSPSAGQLWWNSATNKLYIYYTDANSSQWVQATTPGATGATGAAGAAGSAGAAGAAGPAAGRNAIINGDFQIWQRGTSFTASGYTSDRWRLDTFGGAGTTLTQQSFTVGQTDVPNNPVYYLRAVTTTDSSSDAGTILSQRVEGARTFAGQTITVSFYAKADASKDINIELRQDFGTGGSPSSQIAATTPQKFTISTSWAKYTKTFSVASVSGKTFGTNNNDYFRLAFWLDAGSDYNSRTNSLGNQSGTFDFAQVQVEVGSSATDFEGKTYGDTIEQCQRYYVEWTPTTNYGPIGIGRAWGSNNMNLSIYLPTRMRAQPSVSKTGSFDIVGIGGGASGLHLDGWAYPNFLKLGVTGQNNFNTGANFFYQVEGTNNTSSRIHIDAEL